MDSQQLKVRESAWNKVKKECQSDTGSKTLGALYRVWTPEWSSVTSTKTPGLLWLSQEIIALIPAHREN